MALRPFYRFRQLAVYRGSIVTLAILFLLLEGGCRYLESKNIPVGDILPIRPGYALLFVASVFHGFSRVVAFHPIWNPRYQIWLESTPWTGGKSLPMGPVQLDWEDGLIVGLIILLNATLPQPRSMPLLCAFLLSQLLVLTVTHFVTRAWAIGYSTAFALGLAVWLWRQPLACLAASTLVYLLAYEGLRRGLARFPWKRLGHPNADVELLGTEEASAMLGWPYDRMIREIVGDDGISRIDAVLCSMLIAWWLVVLSSFFSAPDRPVVLSMFYFGALALCPPVRLYIYTKGYHFPITVWGRIWTGRWIIPGYDQVFVAPICTILVGPLSLFLLRNLRVPVEISLPISTSATLVVALITPPRLRRWRLTGQHRIVPLMSLANSQPNSTFVKVG